MKTTCKLLIVIYPAFLHVVKFKVQRFFTMGHANIKLLVCILIELNSVGFCGLHPCEAYFILCPTHSMVDGRPLVLPGKKDGFYLRLDGKVE